MQKEKGNYVFPNIIANVMRKISQRIQYESTLMSLTIILISLIVVMVFTIFFTNVSTFVKVMAVINGIAGFIFLSSFLVTSFQQYQNYLAVMGIIDDHDTFEEVKGGIEENHGKR